MLSICSLGIYQCSCFLSVNFASELFDSNEVMLFLTLLYFRINIFIGAVLLCSLTKLYIEIEVEIGSGKVSINFCS